MLCKRTLLFSVDSYWLSDYFFFFCSALALLIHQFRLVFHSSFADARSMFTLSIAISLSICANNEELVCIINSVYQIQFINYWYERVQEFSSTFAWWRKLHAAGKFKSLPEGAGRRVSRDWRLLCNIRNYAWETIQKSPHEVETAAMAKYSLSHTSFETKYDTRTTATGEKSVWKAEKEKKCDSWHRSNLSQSSLSLFVPLLWRFGGRRTTRERKTWNCKQREDVKLLNGGYYGLLCVHYAVADVWSASRGTRTRIALTLDFEQNNWPYFTRFAAWMRQ